MVLEEPSRQEPPSAISQPDPFEGVPPGCLPPRPMWPLWFALIGFVVWVIVLLVIMFIRLRTSVV